MPIQIPTNFKTRRTAASAWLERTNPLAGLSIRAAQRIYDAARGGDFSRIQYLYSEIERENPVLMTCVDRRASALSGLGWKVSTQRDGAEADEQKAALEERLAGAEGMDEALEHLALAFFRGFAHVRPLWNGPGSLAGFDLLNGWNFARDPATGQWFWNPRAEYCDPSHPGPGLVPVPAGELVTVSRVREIDRPAMALCLRDAVGARDWGRFLERYGIPFVVFTAPPTASDETMPRFAEAAEKIADGLSTAVPAGSTVSFAGEARNADPFTPFETQIHKLIVLMSTGGTLTSLAESGAGTLAGNAQMEVWNEIVKRDGVAIGAAIDRAVCRPLLRGIRDFAGRPPLVKFELGGDRQLDPGEIFDIAAKARAAGYRVAKDELEKATGYTLEEEVQTVEGPDGLTVGRSDGRTVGPWDRRNGIANPLQNARKGGEVHLPPPAKETRQNARESISALSAAFARDLGPAAGELRKLLDLPDAELADGARELMGRLDDLLPSDPETAAVLAEEMAKAFAEGAGQTISLIRGPADKAPAGGESGTRKAGAEAALANSNKGKCPDCGQWLDGHGVCHECHAADEAAKAGENPDSAEVQAAEIGKGRTAIRRCLSEKRDMPDAVTRSDIGSISILYGSPVDTPEGKAWGLSHFAVREDTVAHLPETLVRGKAGAPYQDGQKRNIVHGKYTAVLTLTNDPEKPPKPERWVLTAFQPSDKDIARSN